MPAIGHVKRQPDGTYKGNLATLSMRAPIEFQKNDKTKDTQPDFIIRSNGIEVGAAWNRTSPSSGNEYISVSLAAPEFGNRSLYANLGRPAGSDDEDEFAIIWNPQD